MDKSLDEIIATKPKTGRRGPATRRRSTPTARNAILGKAQPAPVQRVSAAAATKVADPAGALPSEKIVVSGLPLDVNEAQVKDLFASTIGPVRDISLSYNAQGRSKGIATVTFSKKGDGNKAYKEYNNRLIDGNQPMKIEILVDPIRSVSLASRVAAAPGGAPKTAPQQRTTGPVRRRPQKTPRAPKPAPKTAADLDAEMEDYTAQATAPAAAAAPAPTA